MQKDGVDSMDNSMDQKDVKEVQRHKVVSANNPFRLEDKKDIEELLVTATMMVKKNDAGNGINDGLKEEFTNVANSSVLSDETKNPETSTALTKNRK